MNERRQRWSYLGYFGVVVLLAGSACNSAEWALDVGTTGGAEEAGAEGNEEADAADGGSSSTGEAGDGGGEAGGVPCGYAGMLGGDYDVSFPMRDEEHPNYRLFSPAEDGDCDFDGILDPSQNPHDMALRLGFRPFRSLNLG